MKNLQAAAVKTFAWAISLTAIFGIFSCQNTPTDIPQYNADLVALTDNNLLLKLNASDPSQTNKRITITGLANNEKVLAIDFRPATGQLYGVSNLSRIYPILEQHGQLALWLLRQLSTAQSSVSTSIQLWIEFD
jgi:hypothetical protein